MVYSFMTSTFGNHSNQCHLQNSVSERRLSIQRVSWCVSVNIASQSSSCCKWFRWIWSPLDWMCIEFGNVMTWKTREAHFNIITERLYSRLNGNSETKQRIWSPPMKKRKTYLEKLFTHKKKILIPICNSGHRRYKWNIEKHLFDH